MTRIPTTFLVAIATLALGLLSIGSAQAQGTHRGQHYTKADVERIIKRVEERSDDFRKVIDRQLDRSTLDGTNREDNINQQVKELENAIDKLRSDFDRAQSWEETRAQVQRVMNEADEVNALVRRGRWRRGGPVKAAWAQVRVDLKQACGRLQLALAGCLTFVSPGRGNEKDSCEGAGLLQYLGSAVSLVRGPAWR